MFVSRNHANLCGLVVSASQTRSMQLCFISEVSALNIKMVPTHINGYSYLRLEFAVDLTVKYAWLLVETLCHYGSEHFHFAMVVRIISIPDDLDFGKGIRT